MPEIQQEELDAMKMYLEALHRTSVSFDNLGKVLSAVAGLHADLATSFAQMSEAMKILITQGKTPDPE